ncbi:MAG: Gfo/Idh/MocA family oxidoreductase [Planctomycetota bacterium]|nr:Gfo/Idh/MocA family oxidoreductase [Planctomycetota bacterium]MDA1137317.1 Gfo/Idh/MocA family oxidoreductase [Planctomycetota bacterium]
MVQCALVSGRTMGLRHGSNFNNHPDAKVVAVCDMDPELRAKVEKEYDAPGYATLDELLENCGAELVLLIVNETRRIEPVRRLLAAGRNVFTEKPLCGLEGQFRLREEDAVIAAPAIREWRESGLKFGIDFNYRFMEHFRKLHDDITNGVLGELKMIRARAHFNCWSHIIDQILWSMGLPEWVSAYGNPSEEGGWQRSIRMQWANGASGSLEGTNTWGMEIPLSIIAVGDKSYGWAQGLQGWYRRAKSNVGNLEIEELFEAEEGAPEMRESFVRMADGVIKGMQNDTAFPADGEAAWNELLFEAAVYRSCINDGARVVLADVEADAMRS